MSLSYRLFSSDKFCFCNRIHTRGIAGRQKGKEKVLIAGFHYLCWFYFGFGFTDKKASIVALFALYGLYSAATDGIQKAFISDMIDKNKKGTGLGIYNALLGLTLLPASFIAGILYDRVNSSVPFYFGAVTASVSAVLMLLFLIRFRKAR